MHLMDTLRFFGKFENMYVIVLTQDFYMILVDNPLSVISYLELVIER